MENIFFMQNLHSGRDFVGSKVPFIREVPFKVPGWISSFKMHPGDTYWKAQSIKENR